MHQESKDNISYVSAPEGQDANENEKEIVFWECIRKYVASDDTQIKSSEEPEKPTVDHKKSHKGAKISDADDPDYAKLRLGITDFDYNNDKLKRLIVPYLTRFEGKGWTLLINDMILFYRYSSGSMLFLLSDIASVEVIKEEESSDSGDKTGLVLYSIKITACEETDGRMKSISFKLHIGRGEKYSLRAQGFCDYLNKKAEASKASDDLDESKAKVVGVLPCVLILFAMLLFSLVGWFFAAYAENDFLLEACCTYIVVSSGGIIMIFFAYIWYKRNERSINQETKEAHEQKQTKDYSIQHDRM